MSDKRVLITGAGSGIGRGLALGLAEKGHHLLVGDLNTATARETVEIIEVNRLWSMVGGRSGSMGLPSRRVSMDESNQANPAYAREPAQSPAS